MATHAKPSSTSRGEYDDYAPGGLETGTTVVGVLEVTRVVREHISIAQVAGGMTIGQFVDGLISDAVADGGEIQDLHLTITPEQWKAIVG